MPMITLGASGTHKAWVEVGGRGIDTAFDYGDWTNQEIGAAARESGLGRSDFFYEDKVPCCPSPATWALISLNRRVI